MVETRWQTRKNISSKSYNKQQVTTHHRYVFPTATTAIHATPVPTATDSRKVDDIHRTRTCHTSTGNSSYKHHTGRSGQCNSATSPRPVAWGWEDYVCCTPRLPRTLCERAAKVRMYSPFRCRHRCRYATSNLVGRVRVD